MPPESTDPTIRSAWQAVHDRLRRSVPATTYDMWLRPVRLAGQRGGSILLTAPEKTRAWIERRYLPIIARAIADELGHPVSVTLDGSSESRSAAHPDCRPNPSYTFERFVFGEANHLAHAAALTVAEAPAEAYNPLFIYGPPGLGKTHLLCAVANYLELNAPSLTVRYTTAEAFTSEFVGALRSSGIQHFKSRYRDLDVLLIDDVHFLEGKQSTEEELFHTFNALYESGSQLVFTADRLPRELSTLADRLRDRFEWGLTVAIDRPSLAVRRAVLHRLVTEAGVRVDDASALTLLATRVDSSIRQLHGALTRLIAHASLTSRPLDTELIESVLGPNPQSADRSEGATFEELLTRIDEIFDTSSSEIAGPGRSRRVLRARQAAILIAREHLQLSFPEIGQRLGGRDHSTIHHAHRRALELSEEDPDFNARINRLRAGIHSDAP